MKRALDEVICFCEEITYQEILNAIHNGADTVEAITDLTKAGLACGTCISDLEEILEEELK